METLGWSAKVQRIQRTSSRRVARSVLLSMLLLAGCSTIPGERPTSGQLPETWVDAPAGGEGGEASLLNWWTGFNDPTLDRLVAEALTQGPSVQLALSRVREARALSRTTFAQYLPELSLSASGRYVQGLRGGDLPTANGASAEAEQMTGTYGPQVSWEIPLFARIEAAALGARANERASLADVRAAEVALAADVAQAYVDLRSAQNQRAALEESVAAADQLTQILDTGARAGFTSEADAADARRLAEGTRARLPGVAIEARRAENVLAVLRGLAPGAEAPEIAVALSTQAEVPSLPITQAPAAPADLIRLRPDVAAAEAQALVAAAGVGEARADLLPSLNLTGFIDITDNLIGSPLAGLSSRAVATPLISIPLFDWGSRIAAINRRDAQFEQALISYRDTVNRGVAEASNALISLDQGSRRLQSARAAEEAAAITARGARASYGAGIQSLSDRLRADQQLIDARLTRIDAEAAQASAGIAVYRAFGGGPPIR